MEYEILSSLPLSGVLEEYEFGSGPEFIAIRIFDDNYLEYCVKFSVGVTNTINAQLIGSSLFVVAGGWGYIFDINSRCLICDSGVANFNGVHSVDSKGVFVVNNNTDLYVFSTSKLIWSSGRISSDGVIVESVNGLMVRGKVFDFMKWVDFYLNLESFTYSCEWEYPKEE